MSAAKVLYFKQQGEQLLIYHLVRSFAYRICSGSLVRCFSFGWSSCIFHVVIFPPLSSYPVHAVTTSRRRIFDSFLSGCLLSWPCPWVVFFSASSAQSRTPSSSGYSLILLDTKSLEAVLPLTTPNLGEGISFHGFQFSFRQTWSASTTTGVSSKSGSYLQEPWQQWEAPTCTSVVSTSSVWELKCPSDL